LWDLIQEKGRVTYEEMFRVFNMGIGMVAIVDRSDVAKVQERIPEPTYIIGELIQGERKVLFAKQEALQSVE
jgi:phosphoribosylformylglycinamidine cyclo-ligase